MTQITKLDEKVYIDHDVLQHLNHTLMVINRLGTSNRLLTEEEKGCLQYAHDALQAIRNNLMDELKNKTPETSPAIVVPTKRGTLVHGVSGISDRCGVMSAEEFAKKQKR